MSPVRLWHQTIKHDGGEISRITFAEVDLAASLGSTPQRVDYMPFDHQVTPDLLFKHADYYSGFGLQAPARRSVLVVSDAGQPSTTAHRYPGTRSKPIEWRGATVVDADAAEVAVLQSLMRDNRLNVAQDGAIHAELTDADHRSARQIISTINSDSRALFMPQGRSDLRLGPKASRQPVDLLVPVNGHAGMMRAAAPSGDVAFTAGFFILAEEEVAIDPFTRVMDPIGLTVSDGQVMDPPIYDRPALLLEGGSALQGTTTATVRMVGPKDWSVQLPGGVTVDARSASDTLGGTRSDRPLEAGVWTPAARRRGHLATPPSHQAVDFVLKGRRVVAWREKGNTPIPVNGAVVRVDAVSAKTVLDEIDMGNVSVGHLVDGLETVRSGIQGWVILAHAGAPLDPVQQVQRTEIGGVEYGAEGVPLPPVFLVERYLTESNRAHTVVGVHPTGRMFVAYAEACEPRTYRRGHDSRGASLPQLRDALLKLGCTDIIALDGGGSAGIVVSGEPTGAPADRFDIAGLPLERPLAGAFVVKGAP